MAQINIDKIYDEGQQKWRKAIFAANLVFAGVIFVMELVMFGVLEFQGLRTQPIFEYLLQYFVIPTILDILILYVGYMMMQNWKVDPKILNYIPLVQMIMLCLVLTTIHHLFAVTFTTFCFPIFVSVLFHDRKLTHRLTKLSIACLTLMAFVGPRINQVNNKFLFASYLISVAIVSSANILCDVLMQYGVQRDEKLDLLYRSRLEIMDQLKYDQKTGLHGHTSFQNTLRKLVEKASETNRPALALFDIDDFKKVNDRYGHMNGDNVIVEVARIIREVCGEDYTAARFGGEEFAVLFEGGTLESYIDTVERIRMEMERIQFEFRREPVTLSAGIAIWKEGWDSTEFFDHADEALYTSKRQGKNRTTVCDGENVQSVSIYQWTRNMNQED